MCEPSCGAAFRLSHGLLREFGLMGSVLSAGSPTVLVSLTLSQLDGTLRLREGGGGGYRVPFNYS